MKQKINNLMFCDFSVEPLCRYTRCMVSPDAADLNGPVQKALAEEHLSFTPKESLKETKLSSWHRYTNY